MIEDANKYFFYIRPRRFGKSLTISMLHHYYDVRDKANFEKWYGGLYIGEHPTEERNSYLVIYLNFAVVNAELHSYRQSLDAHCNMIEENIRVDYNKLRMLIRKDKEFAHDASVIQTLVQQGYVTGNLKTGFPAEQITDPDNFVSLLFYFGMLTVSGTCMGKTKLTIPNQVVREQLFAYLLDTYHENDLSFDSYQKDELASRLAYLGEWHPYFGYIAD